MIKKGGFFLGLILCTLSVLAQDKLDALFSPDNPNLMRLNEATEYKGQPLVYIEGVTPPEKATNDIEALQLKVFGTKKVQDVTRDNLTLSAPIVPTSENQIQNYTFEDPFHNTIQAGFIHHIARFMVNIQLLDQHQLVVHEYVTLMNTQEDLTWTRQLPLPVGAEAFITHYVQNGQTYKLNQSSQNTLSFVAPQPLNLGPNQLALSYYINNPYPVDQLQLELTGTHLDWPIEKFSTVILFPNEQVLQDSKLTFGTNHLDVPQIYTQQTDSRANLYAQINRIIPPKASIQVNLSLNVDKLPVPVSDTSEFLMWTGLLLLVLYWIFYAWWVRYSTSTNRPTKIKYPKNLILFPLQLGRQPNNDIAQQLIDFYQRNHIPADKIVAQYNNWLKHPLFEQQKAKIKNFCSLTFEVIIGTVLLLTCLIFPAIYLNFPLTLQGILALIFISVVICCGMYIFILKPNQQYRWKKHLQLLSTSSYITGLTAEQIYRIYPLFIAAQQAPQWCNLLTQTNPKLAKEVHLL